MRALLRTPRILASVLFVTVAAAWPLASGQQVPAQPPQFRAGVEVMRVELTVLDKRTREPIRGLAAGDFVVKVDGQPQEVVAFSEVVMPAPDRTVAAWTRESPKDVATNAAPPGDQRLILIVMDDAVTTGHMGGAGTDLFHRKVAKAAAHGIIDELGPHDLAAVLFVQFNQHAQDFTADRAALRRAVDTYNPQPLDPLLANPMSLGTLTRAGGFLAAIPERRRAIFYVTAGPYGAIGGHATLLKVLPFVPTSERTFSRTDIAGALVRVHQSARRPSVGVTLETTITSASGTEVSRSTTRFEAAQFTVTRSVEHRAELALSALTPGDYLLTFAATAGGAAASRQVRFSVE